MDASGSGTCSGGREADERRFDDSFMAIIGTTRRRGMKAVFQRRAQKKGSPVVGMLVVLASICVFLAFLALVTVVVHFIVM